MPSNRRRSREKRSPASATEPEQARLRRRYPNPSKRKIEVSRIAATYTIDEIRNHNPDVQMDLPGLRQLMNNPVMRMRLLKPKDVDTEIVLIALQGCLRDRGEPIAMSARRMVHFVTVYNQYYRRLNPNEWN